MTRTHAGAVALVLLLACTHAPRRADAWGAAGHMSTAALAERHLTSGAAAAASADLAVLRALYPTESDFVTAADWPDFIKASTEAFSTWHYVDLPVVPAGDGGKAPPCGSTSQNVVWALEAAAAVLRSPSSDPWSRSTMLRFLIHFLGDIHQPLHAASLFTGGFPNGDEGGNALKLSPSVAVGRSYVSELHAFWDDGCGASGLETITRSKDGAVDLKAVEALVTKLDGADISAIASRTFTTTQETSAAFKAWAAESHAFAANTSYAPALLAALGENTEVDTKASFWAPYAVSASMVARDRLRLGGARLAQVLNSLHAQHQLALASGGEGAPAALATARRR